MVRDVDFGYSFGMAVSKRRVESVFYVRGGG